MENVDIRSYIKANFKDSKESDIKESIISSIQDKDEVTLPGLGVLFEVLWENSDDELKEKILKILKANL